MTCLKRFFSFGLIFLFVMGVSAFSMAPQTQDKDVIVGGKPQVFPGDNNSSLSEEQIGYNIRDQDKIVFPRSTQYKPDPTAASVLNFQNDNLAVVPIATCYTGKTRFDNASPGGALAYEL